MTGPVLEGPVKCAYLGEPEEKCDLANGKPMLDQVAYRQFATHFGQDTAKSGSFFLQPAMQSPGTHAKSLRQLLEFRLTIGKRLREKTAHRVGCGFGFRQLRKQCQDLGFDDLQQDRICFDKGQSEKIAGKDQFATTMSKLQRAAEQATVFRRIRRSRMGKAHLNRSPVNPSGLPGRD